MSPKLKCDKDWNMTISEVSLKLKGHLKCHHNWKVIKTEISVLQKCY